MIKIIAIGNRLMGDDGVAIQVIESIKDELEKLRLKVIIGETDFEYSIREIENDDFIIIIDSTYLGKEPGEVTVFNLEEYKLVSGYKDSQHQLKLMDILNIYNKKVVGYIIGIEVYDISFNLSLSEKLKASFETIKFKVLEEIKNILEGVINA